MVDYCNSWDQTGIVSFITRHPHLPVCQPPSGASGQISQRTLLWPQPRQGKVSSCTGEVMTGDMMLGHCSAEC